MNFHKFKKVSKKYHVKTAFAMSIIRIGRYIMVHLKIKFYQNFEYNDWWERKEKYFFTMIKF